MYIYLSHLGELYASETEINEDDLFCEACGDADTLLGCAENKEEARKIIKIHYRKDPEAFLNQIFK